MKDINFILNSKKVAALLETIGSGAVSNPFYDCENSEVIIIIGANPTENHPVAATFFKIVFKKTKLEKNIKKQLLDFRRYIEKNCRNVGKNFTNEARNIHYDKKTSQGIYGKATPEETSELLEEGIEVASIPWIDESEN